MELDVRGLRCPIPYARAAAALRALAPDEDLVVFATDPEAPIDLGALAVRAGFEFAVEGERITLRRPRHPGAGRPRP